MRDVDPCVGSSDPLVSCAFEWLSPHGRDLAHASTVGKMSGADESTERVRVGKTCGASELRLLRALSERAQKAARGGAKAWMQAWKKASLSSRRWEESEGGLPFVYLAALCNT